MLMTAVGEVVQDGHVKRIEWLVRNISPGHSMLRLGEVEIAGRTFGLLEPRSVVFSARARECPGLESADNEFIDVLRVSAPIRKDGTYAARHYEPHLALKLRELAHQRKRGDATGSIRRQIDELMPRAIVVMLHVRLEL